MTASESATLAQIRANESNNNYGATNPYSTASGAYQIINATWQTAASNVGIDTSVYPTAGSAPPSLQDAAALWLLQKYGPNASITWAASAPPGGYPTGLDSLLANIGISPPSSFPSPAPGGRIAPESYRQTLREDSD